MRSALEAHSVTGRDEDEAGFLGGRNNLDLDTGFAPDTGHEFRAVLGLAHRAGRNSAHPIDATKFDQLLEVAERADREIHRLLAEASGFEGTPAKANCFLHAVDNVDIAVAITIGNHHVH